MKVAITSAGKDLDSSIDQRFGRASYFIVADTDSYEFEVLENDKVSAGHGVGVQVGQFVADLDVDALITGNVGPNAMKVLKASGIDVYGASTMTIRQAIEGFSQGKLEKILDATSGPHNV